MNTFNDDVPIFESVKEDLGIDPLEQSEISHEDRFLSVLNAHRSELL